MGINIGLDIGAISLKLAALGNRRTGRCSNRSAPAIRPSACIALRRPSAACSPTTAASRAARSSPPTTCCRSSTTAFPKTASKASASPVRGSRTIAKILGLFFENEFKAIARMMGAFYPQVRTVFEIGGESSKYIRLEDGGIVDYDRSGECAAGTGSFLDQQALRMQYSVEEVGGLVCEAGCAARIAGRCSVFAKSDMIHAQQKGYSPAEILRGLCDAVARNFKSAIVKGRPVEAPVALIGAVSQNEGVTGALREAFGLAGEQLFVPASTTPGAAPSAPPCWKPRSRASAPSSRSTACTSTRPRSACRTPSRSPWTTWCCCATACRSTCRRPTTRRSPPTWGSTSARSPPTWW